MNKKVKYCSCGNRIQGSECDVCKGKTYYIKNKRYYRGRIWKLGNEKPFFHDDPPTNFNF